MGDQSRNNEGCDNDRKLEKRNCNEFSNTEIQKKNYKLNITRAKNKIANATERSYFFHATMKKRGNLYIALTPATFACFRTGIINTAKEVGENDIKIKGDQDSIVVEETVFFREQKVTVNLYHTKSSALINGAGISLFVKDILPQLQGQSQENGPLISAMDSLIREAMSEFNGKGEEKVTKEVAIRDLSSAEGDTDEGSNSYKQKRKSLRILKKRRTLLMDVIQTIVGTVKSM